MGKIQAKSIFRLVPLIGDLGRFLRAFTLKSLNSFGGCFFNIRDACMDFEPYFKVYNLVSVYPNSINLGQKTNLNVIFHVMVSVCGLVKI